MPAASQPRDRDAAHIHVSTKPVWGLVIERTEGRVGCLLASRELRSDQAVRGATTVIWMIIISRM